MRRIEDVGAVLEPFAAPALFAVVQADGDDGQNGEGLDGDLHTTQQELLPLVAEAVDGNEHKLCKVSARTEELHRLAYLHCGNAACDCIIITVCCSHQIIIFVLDRR